MCFRVEQKIERERDTNKVKQVQQQENKMSSNTNYMMKQANERTNRTHVPRQKMSIREMLSPRRIKCMQLHSSVTNAYSSRTNSKQYYGKDDAAINFLRRFATTTTTPKMTTAAAAMSRKYMFSTFLFLFLCIGPTVWQMFSIRFSHFCMS